MTLKKKCNINFTLSRSVHKYNYIHLIAFLVLGDITNCNYAFNFVIFKNIFNVFSQIFRCNKIGLNERLSCNIKHIYRTGYNQLL